MSKRQSLLGARTIKQATRLMKANVFTAPELCDEVFKNMEDNNHLNAFVNYRDRDVIMKEAEAAQQRIEKSNMSFNFLIHCHNLILLHRFQIF